MPRRNQTLGTYEETSSYRATRKNGICWAGHDISTALSGIVARCCANAPDWDVTIVDEKVEPLDLEQSADLVGITTMTTTSLRAYEIADHFRRRGIKVVMGGMHVSSLPDEALEHCDSVVVGEAEHCGGHSRRL